MPNIDPSTRRRAKRQTTSLSDIDDELPDSSLYDDGMWRPDPASAAAPLATLPAAVTPPVPLSSMPMIRPPIVSASSATPISIVSPSATSVEVPTSAASRPPLSSSPPPAVSANATADSNSAKDNNDDDSGFKVAYLTPIFVLIGVFLICSLGGRLWGRMWHARKLERERRDRHAQRLASDFDNQDGQSSLHGGTWDGRPLSLHDKESGYDDGGDDYESEDGDDEKQPGAFHVLSQRIMGDKSRIAPPTTRSRAGRFEGKVQSNSWLSVQVRRIVSPEALQVGVDRYTAVQPRSLRPVPSRDRLRQLRGDIEAGQEGGSLLHSDVYPLGAAAEKLAAQQPPSMWDRLKGQWMGRSSPRERQSMQSQGLGLSFADPEDSERLWTQRPAARLSPPSSIEGYDDTGIGGGPYTTLPQPKFASNSETTFARHPSTLGSGSNNLRSRSRGYEKPLPDIVDIATPAVAAASTSRDRYSNDALEEDDVRLSTVITVDRHSSQTASENTYSATSDGVTLSGASDAVTSRTTSQSTRHSRPATSGVGRSKTKRRPGTTYMYDEQLPKDAEYYRQESSLMQAAGDEVPAEDEEETPRKWRPYSSTGRGRKRGESVGAASAAPATLASVVTPNKVKRAATTASTNKSEVLLERVKTQQRNTTEYIASTRPLQDAVVQDTATKSDAAVPVASAVRPTPSRAVPRSTSRKSIRESASSSNTAASPVQASESVATTAPGVRTTPSRSKTISRGKTISRAKSILKKPDGSGQTTAGGLTVEELTELLNTPGLSAEAQASTLADLLSLYEGESEVPYTPSLSSERGGSGVGGGGSSSGGEEPHLSSGGGVGAETSSDEESLATDNETATMRTPAIGVGARAGAGAGSGGGAGAGVQRSATMRTTGGIESVGGKSTFYTPLPGFEDIDDDGEKFRSPAYMHIDEPGSLDHVFNVLSKYVGPSPDDGLQQHRGQEGVASDSIVVMRAVMPDDPIGAHRSTPSTPKRANGAVTAAATTPAETTVTTPLSRKKTWAKSPEGRWYRANEEEGSQEENDGSATTPSRPNPSSCHPSILSIASPNPLDRIASPPPSSLIQGGGRHDLFFASPASPTSVITRPRGGGRDVDPTVTRILREQERERERDRASNSGSSSSGGSGGGGGGGSVITSAASTVMPSFGSVVAPAPPCHFGVSESSKIGLGGRTNTTTRRWVSEQDGGVYDDDDSSSSSALLSRGVSGGADRSPQRRSAVVKRSPVVSVGGGGGSVATARPPRRYQATLSGGVRSPLSPFDTPTGAGNETSSPPSSTTIRLAAPRLEHKPSLVSPPSSGRLSSPTRSTIPSAAGGGGGRGEKGGGIVVSPLEKERQRQQALDRVRSIVERGYLSKGSTLGGEGVDEDE